MSTTVPRDFDAYFTANQGRIERELFDFLRIPSVSARPEYNHDTARAAEWLAGSMRSAGLTTEILPTGGHPVVLGEWRGAGPDRPTVLVYGHYDVQPAEPLDLWTTPPFDPQVRDGRVYARGAVDDKGQLFLHVKAIESHLVVRGRLPINIVVLAEGEEEVGSDHLGPFVEQHVERLRCNAVVISDSSMFAPGLPSILASLRGLAYFQIDVEGPAQDLHSGGYGGAVVNPATALARIIATFHNPDGHIAIPGFYDRVRAISPELKRGYAALPFDEAVFRKEVGAPALGGEKGYTILEQLWARPTCEVNGLLSGYTGEGAMPEGGLIKLHAVNEAVKQGDADELAAGDYVVLSIEDTGRGMTAETLQKACDPFFTTKSPGEGPGLGLSLVYGFARQSGGLLRIDSAKGRGTTVRLYLPRGTSGEAQPPVPASPVRSSERRYTILLVDDHDLVRTAVTANLESLNYRVLTADRGPAAMLLLESAEPIDLLFTDVVMPGGLSGAEVARRARALRPSIKVLFTSGFTSTALVQNGRLEPGVELLMKPYDLSELVATLKRILEP